MNHTVPCMRSELEIFSFPPTQVSVEKGYWKDHFPISSLQSHAPIEFVDSGSGEDFVDLSNTLLYINASVVKTGNVVVGPDEKVAPVNNLLHSLFSQVDVQLNGIRVSSSTANYAYKAYLETHLNYGDDAKESRLSAQLYCKDNNLHVFEPDTEEETADPNKGLNYRHEICVKSNSFEMIGKPHGDIFNVNRYMLPGVEIRIRLTRSKDAFTLMAPDVAAGYSIRINEAKLLLRKMKIAPNAALAIEKRLKSVNAIYPLVRTECKLFHIPAGTMTYTQDNIFGGQQPKRLTIGLINNASFNGDFKKNPFYFEHFNLNKLCIYIDGERVPWSDLNLSYESGQFIQGYYTLFAGADGISSDTGNSIKRNQYTDGNVIYCFDVTPELSASCLSHVNPQTRGNLRIDLGFSKPLAEVVNVVVLCEFDNFVRIDSERIVSHDFVN